MIENCLAEGIDGVGWVVGCEVLGSIFMQPYEGVPITMECVVAVVFLFIAHDGIPGKWLCWWLPWLLLYSREGDRLLAQATCMCRCGVENVFYFCW